MRLRKGDQVEVLSKKEVSSGSWSCAEIISGNGRSYSVRFFSSEEAMEKVPRRVIRPCPPPVEGSNVWDAGDLAEVFHNSSWKQAKIMKIVGVNCYMVRILGSPLDVMVRKSNLRRRQAWHDGRWFLLGKVHLLTTSYTKFHNPFFVFSFVYKFIVFVYVIWILKSSVCLLNLFCFIGLL